MSAPTISPERGHSLMGLLEMVHWRLQHQGDFFHEIPATLYDERKFNPLGFAWGWRELVEEDVLQAAREVRIADTYTLSELRKEDLLPLLSHEEPWVREVALAALGEVGL